MVFRAAGIQAKQHTHRQEDRLGKENVSRNERKPGRRDRNERSRPPLAAAVVVVVVSGQQLREMGLPPPRTLFNRTATLLITPHNLSATPSRPIPLF